MVGTIVDALEAAQLTSKTNIIFSSDHGFLNMEHHQIELVSMFEATNRVPLIFSGPSIMPNMQMTHPVSLVDLFPSVCELVRVPPTLVPSNLRGQSLLSHMNSTESTRGSCAKLRPWIFSEYHDQESPTAEFMIIVNGTWKLVVYPGYAPQLFNIVNDPDEMTDLSYVNQSMVMQLEQLLFDEVGNTTLIDAAAKASDKSHFLEWKTNLGENYNYTISNLRWSPGPNGFLHNASHWLAVIDAWLLKENL